MKQESADTRELRKGGPGRSAMVRVKDYFQLIKLSLSIMVVFSSVISFMLTKGFEAYGDKLFRIVMLFAGGLLVTGGANAINQVVEKDTDSIMKRTGQRPVAAGRLRSQ